MSYTMLSARYSNIQGTAVIVKTAEFGDVLVVPERVELWEQLIESGLSIEPYVEPVKTVPDPAAPTVINGSNT